MKRVRRRKCLHCGKLFKPDRRCSGRQRYCGESACRRASKHASQQRWLSKPENQDYFKGPEQVARVKAWRERHPQRARSGGRKRETVLQDQRCAQPFETKEESATLTEPLLQDLIAQQVPVLVGLIATLSDLALQDEIALTTRRLIRLGADILAQSQGDVYETDPLTRASTPAPPTQTVQLDRPAAGP